MTMSNDPQQPKNGPSSDPDRVGTTGAAEAFARLHMEGKDFEKARIPLDSLVELQRYHDIVLKAATLAWERENQGQKLPDDFSNSFKLVLSEVEDGSATSVLELPRSTSYDAYYTLGREEVEREIEAMETWLAQGADRSDSQILDNLPLLSEPSFIDFGKDMPDDSALSLSEPEAPKPIAITKRLRETALLPLAAKREELLAPETDIERHSIRGDIAGRLISLDAEKKGFDFVTLRFGRVRGRYRDESLTSDLRAVLNSSTKAPVVRVSADLRFQGEQLKSLLDVTTVELLEIDGQPWSRRFIELASLDKGWDFENPESEPVVFACLDAARALLEYCSEIDVRLPGIFPINDGGIQLEWANPNIVTNIEILPSLEFSLFNLEVATRQNVNLDTYSIDEVKQFIQRMVR